ncbi:MAG: hypothetical protein IV105_13900 [Rhizobacter sp.]|nr:hypothetical protein [Rhizobacter sp.]
MNSTTCHLDRPLPTRPVAQLWHAIASRWSAHLEAARKAQEFNFVEDLSAETLRDIGAPDQLISRAVVRQESQQHRLLELRQWRGG